MQIGLKIHTNRNTIKETEGNNKSPNDSFTLWFQKIRTLYSLRNTGGLTLLSLPF